MYIFSGKCSGCDRAETDEAPDQVPCNHGNQAVSGEALTAGVQQQPSSDDTTPIGLPMPDLEDLTDVAMPIDHGHCMWDIKDLANVNFGCTEVSWYFII